MSKGFKKEELLEFDSEFSSYNDMLKEDDDDLSGYDEEQDWLPELMEDDEVH